MARTGGLDELAGERPELRIRRAFARVLSDAEEAGQHSDDVAVENRARLVESDAANRPGGVPANAGKGEDVLESLWERSVVLAHDRFGRPLKIARPLVVAETFPEFQDVVGIGGSQRRDVRKCAHPTFPIWDDGFHLGLLEHDFRDPNGVGIARATPREVAGVFGEPGQKWGDQRFGRAPGNRNRRRILRCISSRLEATNRSATFTPLRLSKALGHRMLKPRKRRAMNRSSRRKEALISFVRPDSLSLLRSAATKVRFIERDSRIAARGASLYWDGAPSSRSARFVGWAAPSRSSALRFLSGRLESRFALRPHEPCRDALPRVQADQQVGSTTTTFVASFVATFVEQVDSGSGPSAAHFATKVATKVATETIQS